MVENDNMIRTQISFYKALYLCARRTAKRWGVSLAEPYRRSVGETLVREDAGTEPPRMRYAGIVEGAPQDRTTVHEVVYGREAP